MAKVYSKGDVLAERFVIEEFLNAAGQGLAYRAKERSTRKTVFLKQLNADMRTTVGRIALERLKREQSISIESEHIPKVRGGFEFEGAYFIVTEFIEGQSLDERLAGAVAPLPVREARDIVRQSATGLGNAHELNVVHRDIKPANLMLGTDGIVRIVDWGLARFLDGRTIHESSDPLGTIHFMSPEHLRNKGVDRLSDLFSLGSVAYVCLTLRHPFDGADEEEIFRNIAFSDPVPPSSLNPEVDSDFDNIVLKLLKKEKTRRYPDAYALIRDLDEGFGAAEPEARCGCGEPIARGTRFCLACGSRLHESREPYAGSLHILNGAYEGRRIEVSPAGVDLGRHNMGPDDDFVSRRHARIIFSDGAYWIEDIGSCNGTAVNALSIPKGGRHPLHPGDHIRCADTFVEFLA